MSLWGSKDLANNAPKYLSTEDAGRVYFVDTTEAANTANRARGLQTPGWNLYRTYTDSDGNTRHRVEPLVAMSRTAAQAGDVGAITLTISEIENGKTYTIKATPSLSVTNIIVGEPYVILTAGNTDFTTVGAANSDVGVSFTANNVGVGSGTVLYDLTTIGAANNDVGTTFTANSSSANSSLSVITRVDDDILGDG